MQNDFSQQPEHSPDSSSGGSTLTAVVTAVVITALLVGGAVFITQQQRINVANERVEALRQQVAELQQEKKEQQEQREKQQPATTTGSSPTDNATDSAQNTTTTGEIDTSDWKTYRNKEYGFRLKYPSWYKGVTGCQPSVYDEHKTVYIGPIRFGTESLSEFTFTQFVSEKTQPPGEDASEAMKDSYKLHSKEKMQFAGREAVKVVESFCTAASCYKPSQVYIKKGEESVFVIEYNDGVINQCPVEPEKTEKAGHLRDMASETAEKLLSTFRFLE